MNNKRILVGMSGGIDSSATCIMLQRQGYEVVGITMRTYDLPTHFSSPGQELPDEILKAQALAGYNLFVTSEIHMSDSEVYHTYHNLWRIEESFRIMKSQLDARPVYLQKEDTITGHFLICYLAVLLTRLLQFKVLGDQYCSEDILNFFKQFRAARVSERKYINLTRNSTFIREFAQKTELPLTSYFLTESQIKKMLSHRF